MASALVLGGSGLVGYQVARRLAEEKQADRIVLAALTHDETMEAVESLRHDCPGLEVTGYSGNLFMPGDPLPAEPGAEPPPMPSRGDPELRAAIFDDLYQDFESAYHRSLLAKLVDAARPDIVVDAVNTATGISYQDVFTASQAVRADMDAKRETLQEDVEKLLVSLSIPQLILHVRILNRVLNEVGTRIYLKVGTTGTGGMGLNIPYTHGEERPSPQLLNKTAIAFAQTGMLFLMGRTPGGPIIKEVKPAALIGYRGVDYRAATGRQFHRRTREDGSVTFELGAAGEPYRLYRPREVSLESTLDLTPDPDGYESLRTPDGSEHIRVPLVDTGENGLFTRGEFEAITSLDQMEYITPEEIAEVVCLEVAGGGTGSDVITAVDSAVLGSTYKAGLLRPAALDLLRRLEEEHGVPSIALGRLGPPDLAKHLFEAHLFQTVYGSLDAVAALAREDDAPERASRALHDAVRSDELLSGLIVSIGIPILCPDGRTLLRGPLISSPPYRSFRSEVPAGAEDVDGYAATWVDLRPGRMAWWLETFATMAASRFSRDISNWSTARVNRETYLADDIEIGNVVAWIFSNQGQGFRVL